nr:hypothetical protein 108 [Pelagibacteraceae bacterium]
MDYINGKYVANSPEELQELLQMATSGRGYSNSSASLGLDSPAVAAASVFLPGAMGASDLNLTGSNLRPNMSASNVEQLVNRTPLFRSNPATPTGYSAGMPGLTSLPDGPSSQMSGYTTRATRGIQAGLMKPIDPSGIMTSTAKDVSWLGKRVGLSPKVATKVGRFAGRAVPVLGAISNVQDVLGLVTGEESLGNKAMDTAAMAAGGGIGFMLGGPLGASLGASAGKALSDGTQYLFGDKKTPEQRKMELALQQLQGGGMY